VLTFADVVALLFFVFAVLVCREAALAAFAFSAPALFLAIVESGYYNQQRSTGVYR